MSKGTVNLISWGLILIMLIIHPKENGIHKFNSIALTIYMIFDIAVGIYFKK